MTYASRNTLILGILLLLMSVGGGLWTRMHMGGQVKKLKQVEAERRKKLDGLNQEYSDYVAAESTLSDLRVQWIRLPKAILPDSTAASAFAYLNDLLAADQSSIQMSFTYQRDFKGKDYGYGLYKVVGNGPFRDVYDLIWRIEYEKPLVKIASLQMQEQKVKEEEEAWYEMQFEMDLQVYYSQRPMPAFEGAMGYVSGDPFVGYDPFDPLIQDEIPPNSEGLVEVEGAVLEAMTAGWVIVRDPRGRRTLLRVGNRVYLGQLEDISQEDQQAVFVLNKGGIVDRVVLEMTKVTSPPEEETRSLDFQQALQDNEQIIPRTEAVRFLGWKVTRSDNLIQVIIQNTAAVSYQDFELDAPLRIVVDMEPAMYASDQRNTSIEDAVIREIRGAQFKQSPPVVRVVIELKERVHYAITQWKGEITVNILTSTVGTPTEGER